MDRYCDSAGVDAAKEASDAVQPRPAQNQDTLTGCAQLVQFSSDCARLQVQPAVSQLATVFPVAVVGETEGKLVAIRVGALPEKVQ